MINKIHHGDCLEVMKDIPDQSVDMILCDLPYGTTSCEWDVIIPFNKLWEQYNRILKRGGHAVLFSAQPFTTTLINSNLPNYKYTWYWIKNNVTGFAFAKYQPMRKLEEINVFRFDKQDNKGRHVALREYFFAERAKTGLTTKQINELLGNQMTSHYFTNGEQFTIPTKENYEKLQSTGHFKRSYEDIKDEFEKEKENELFYYPQGLKKVNKKVNGNKAAGVYAAMDDGKGFVQEYTGYPHNILTIDNEAYGNGRLHPTQKPVALCEYLIKTYTKESATVLDNCMGSGTTAIAALNTGRFFIGIEKEKEYVDIANKRIEEHAMQFQLV